MYIILVWGENRTYVCPQWSHFSKSMRILTALWWACLYFPFIANHIHCLLGEIGTQSFATYNIYGYLFLYIVKILVRCFLYWIEMLHYFLFEPSYSRACLFFCAHTHGSYYFWLIPEEDVSLNLCQNLRLSSFSFRIPEVLFHKNVIGVLNFTVSWATPCEQIHFPFLKQCSSLSNNFACRRCVLVSLISSTESKWFYHLIYWSSSHCPIKNSHHLTSSFLMHYHNINWFPLIFTNINLSL